MPSRRQLICDAIVAKLETVTGLTARWLHDGEYDENTESLTPMAVVVPGSDSFTELYANNTVAREVTGHVIIETTASTPMDDESRAAVDEVLCGVESALLQLGADTIDQAQQPGVPISRTVPGVTEFAVTETQTTFDGGEDGRWGARIDWRCAYRHDATNPRTYGGVA